MYNLETPTIKFIFENYFDFNWQRKEGHNKTNQNFIPKNLFSGLVGMFGQSTHKNESESIPTVDV